MRASVPPPDIARIVKQIELSHGIEAVRAARQCWSAATEETCDAVLHAANQFARATLAPLNLAMDKTGCELTGGRISTAPGHKAAWAEFLAAGWPTLEAPEEAGGQGLPSILAFAVQELFDRACPAFGMLPVAQRSAFRLISAFAADPIRSQWLPRLACGDWGATICVSEAEAGSDLSRIRTRAQPDDDGNWRVTGEKCWISYGDHDLTDQIGHIVLAQTMDEQGSRRPSLFLVPAVLPDSTRNAIEVRRIEEKLGLHGSPTCALGFEGATAWLLGERGRGLPQMFVMIANMRLAVGAMGVGLAGACADIALSYAGERKQGGRPGPVPIAEHPDVQLQLLDMMAAVHLMRGLLFAVANSNDLAASGDRDAAALAAWLLPIVKTAGGEIGFDVASAAIQLLGGAGYTREWPVEQALRDARVLTIFEGTTGIQALDLVHRRLLEDDAAFQAFMTTASAIEEPRLILCLAELRTATDTLRGNPNLAKAGATAFLHLAAVAALAWIAARYSALSTGDTALEALGNHWLDVAPANARMLRSHIETNAARVSGFAERFRNAIPSPS